MRAIRQAAVNWILVLGLVLVVCAAGGAAAQDNPTFSCGISHGWTWSLPGGAHGTNWLVLAISNRSQCADADRWTQTLGARIGGHTGEDVQVLSVGQFGCVMIRSQLFAACLHGDGGAGAPGVAVIGNPGQNPWVAALNGSYSPTDQQQVADLAGVPGPKGTIVCGQFDGPRWKFRAGDGHVASGTAWLVRGDQYADGGCSTGVRDLRDLSAQAISDHAMDSRSFLVSGHLEGDWACVAAHDYAYPGGSGTIADVPAAGCARVAFPFGTGSLSGELEQLVVVPEVQPPAGVTHDPVTGVTRPVLEQAVATEQAINHFGIGLVAVAAATAEVTGGPHPGTNAHTDQGIVRCDNHRVGGGTWHHGSAHGDTWLVAVKGGYPCPLAEAVFAPFLAYLALSRDPALPPRSALQRYGWACDRVSSELRASCVFDPGSVYDGDTLGTALGKTVPGIRVAVTAAYPGAQTVLQAAAGAGG